MFKLYIVLKYKSNYYLYDFDHNILQSDFLLLSICMQELKLII